MAKVIRRHWKIALFQFLLLSMSVGLFLHHMLRSTQEAIAATVNNDGSGNSAPTTAPSVDLYTYGRIEAIRERLGLRSEDLAAIGCSRKQAADILTALLSWYSANSDDWRQKEVNVGIAESALDEAGRRVNVGPADDTLISGISSLRENLASVTHQRDSIYQSAIDSVAGILTSDQATVWGATRTNLANQVPSPYLYVAGLSADQVQEIALRAYIGSAPEVSLSADERQAVVNATNQQNIGMAGVGSAENSVLPLPAELQTVSTIPTQ